MISENGGRSGSPSLYLDKTALGAGGFANFRPSALDGDQPDAASIIGGIARRYERKLAREHAAASAEQLGVPIAMGLYVANLEPEEREAAWKNARQVATLKAPGDDLRASRSPQIKGGGDWALNEPERIPACWGDAENVAWAEGEGLLIAGPIGTFKTTLQQRLLRARLGLDAEGLLGYPVAPLPDDQKALYIAADRPRQAARSFRRMLSEDEREVLNGRLVIHTGPPPFDLGGGDEPEQFLRWVEEIDVDIHDVYIDALKDVSPRITQADEGAATNAKFQALIASGRQLCVDHHQRKAHADNTRPKTLNDVYGSIHIPAGMGSVLLCWGAAGDPLVEVTTLKPVAGEIGPLMMSVEMRTGALSVHEKADLVVLAEKAAKAMSIEGGRGLTAGDAACALFDTTKPTNGQREKARRRLDRLTRPGEPLERVEQAAGQPTIYVPREPVS